MSVTFTMFILWLASVPGIGWKFILVGLFADAGSHVISWLIGLKGEWR